MTTCNDPGATHHAGCECYERKRAEERRRQLIEVAWRGIKSGGWAND